MCPSRSAPTQAQSCPSWCQDGSQQVLGLCPEQAQGCDLGPPWPAVGLSIPLKSEGELMCTGICRS